MSNERFANVWDAVEDTPAQAENMRLRSLLMMASVPVALATSNTLRSGST